VRYKHVLKIGFTSNDFRVTHVPIYLPAGQWTGPRRLTAGLTGGAGGWAGLLLGADLLPAIRTALAAHLPHRPGGHPATGTAVRLSRLRPDAVARSAAALAATEPTAAELTASTDRSLAATSPR
jgi:hypothetical protein